MPRWVGGALAGGGAVLLGALAHAVGGGSVQGVALVLLASVGALLGAAVVEFGFGRWGLVATIAVLQVAGHVLFDPLQSHRGGGHAHGVAGQVADANSAAFLDHLTGSAAVMVALHVLAAIVVALLVGVASPLLDLVARAATVLEVRPAVVRRTRQVPAESAPIAASAISLAHIVVRRGPPALV